MSTSYEKKVVSLEFDDRNFTKNADRANQRLAELNQNLRFEDVEYRAQLLASSFDKSMQSMAQSTGDLTKALEKNSDAMSGYGDIAEKMLKGMVSVTYKMTDQITTSIANVGTSFLRQMTTGGMKQGMDMFESRITSMQTIMANFTTYTESQVKLIFDDLNEYAKRTVYTQADMLQAIGKFSAQGVDPAKAAEAVKGISNVSALAGVGKSQNETAMYMLSQVISSGRMSGYQWRSLANSGWSGPFQRELEKVLSKAIANGTATAAEKEAYGRIKGGENIRYTLESGWLTSGRILETLENFASTETEIGKTANEAATSLKTFSQMLDNIKESIASTWNDIYNNIIGGLEDAKELFTGIANIINNRVESTFADTIRTLQEFSESGGVKALRDLIHDIMLFVDQFLDPIQEAFDRIFGGNSGEDLAKNIAKIDEVIQGMFWTPEQLEGIQSVFELIFGVLKLATSVLKGISYLARGISVIVSDIARMLGAITGTLGNVDLIAESIRTISWYIEDAFKNVATTIVWIYRNIGELISNPDAVFAAFEIIGEYIGAGLAVGIATAANWITAIWDEIITGVKETTEDEFGIHSPSKWAMWIGENLLLGLGIGLLIAAPALKITLGAISEIIGSAFENIGVMLAGAGDFMKGTAAFVAVVGLLVTAFAAAYAFLPEEKVERIKKMFVGLKDLIRVVSECLVSILSVITGKTIAEAVAGVVPWGGVNELAAQMGKSAKWAAIAQIIKSITMMLSVVMASVLAMIILVKDLNVLPSDIVWAGGYIVGLMAAITAFIKSILNVVAKMNITASTTKLIGSLGGVGLLIGSIAALLATIVASMVVLIGTIAIVSSIVGENSTSYIVGSFAICFVLIGALLIAIYYFVNGIMRQAGSISTPARVGKIAVMFVTLSLFVIAISLAMNSLMISLSLLIGVTALVYENTEHGEEIIAMAFWSLVATMGALFGLVILLMKFMTPARAKKIMGVGLGMLLMSWAIGNLVTNILLVMDTFHKLYEDMHEKDKSLSSTQIVVNIIVEYIMALAAILAPMFIALANPIFKSKDLLTIGIGFGIMMVAIIAVMEEIIHFADYAKNEENKEGLTESLDAFHTIIGVLSVISTMAAIIAVVIAVLEKGNLKGVLSFFNEKNLSTKLLLKLVAVIGVIYVFVSVIIAVIAKIAKVIKENGIINTGVGIGMLLISIAGILGLIYLVLTNMKLLDARVVTKKRLIETAAILGAFVALMYVLDLIIEKSARTIRDYGWNAIYGVVTLLGAIAVILVTIWGFSTLFAGLLATGVGIAAVVIVLASVLAIIISIAVMNSKMAAANESIENAAIAVADLIFLLQNLVDNREVIDKAADIMGQIVEILTSKLNGPVNELRETVHKFIDDVLKPKELGEYIAEGIATGIKNASGEVSDALSDLSGKLKGTFSAEFDIHSPSKYMAEQGKFLVQGLKIGIEGETGDVEASWEDVINALSRQGQISSFDYPKYINADAEERKTLSANVIKMLDANDKTEEKKNTFWDTLAKPWKDVYNFGPRDTESATSNLLGTAARGLGYLTYAPVKTIGNAIATGIMSPFMGGQEAIDAVLDPEAKSKDIIAEEATELVNDVIGGDVQEKIDKMEQAINKYTDSALTLNDLTGLFEEGGLFGGLIGGEDSNSFLKRNEDGSISFNFGGIGDALKNAGFDFSAFSDIKEELFGEGSIFSPDGLKDLLQDTFGLNNNGLAGAVGQGLSGTGSSAVGNTYAFYQTNNSPKALSRSEIYRQTKNLFAQQKGVQQGIW